MPARLTFCGLFEALSTIVSVAACAPRLSAKKKTSITQLLPGASDDLQELRKKKSSRFVWAPKASEILPSAMEVVPGLSSVT